MTSPLFPLLALDLSTPIAHAAVFTSSATYMHAAAKKEEQHSHALLPLLQNLLHETSLSWGDLSSFAIGQGPGSFTGLRISAATLAGINASLQRPVWGISSLGITSMQIDTDDEIWVIEDARAGEVFRGIYQQGRAVHADDCVALTSLPSFSEGSRNYISNGNFEIVQQGWAQQPLTYERGEGMCRWIQKNAHQQNWSTLPFHVQPSYLQLSQAERQMNHG